MRKIVLLKVHNIAMSSLFSFTRAQWKIPVVNKNGL